MKIRILVLGEKMPKWVQQGYDEYAKRLSSSSIKLELVELPIAKRTKNITAEKCMEQEAKLIFSKLHPQEDLVILDPSSALISTEALASQIESWQQSQPNIAILIGGPDGIADQVKEHAKGKISLSKMTFPHPIVRIILAEQLYRAWTILQGHPYHK